MARRSHVVRRSASSRPKAFPALPTLPAGGRCDGVAILVAAGDPSPDLGAFRDGVNAMWRGRLGPAVSDPDVVIVEFVGGLDLGNVLPAALRLKAGSSGTLTSYLDEPGNLNIARGRPATTARSVDLWWSGRASRLSLEQLAPIPLASLWSPPRLTLHAPFPPSATTSPSAARKIKDGELDAQSDILSVGRAQIALQGKVDDILGDVDGDLKRLEDRTRLSSIFRQLIGAGRRALLEGKGSGASGQPWGRPKEPGVIENLAGWLRWHTPLGAGLRGQFAARLKLVEKLFASGDLDSALKLALALGGAKGEKKGGAFPNFLEGMRSSLDLTFLPGGRAIRILGGDAYETLYSRYTNLAKKLESQGDFRRAAYVYSKLLDDHRQAALCLERGDLHREGAKLAMDSGLEPVLTIRLLYKAGELSAALALARRTGSFEQLAEDSRGKEGAYHAYVVGAWTEALIATGQPLRALQVTDRLAAGGDPPQPLLDARRRWLAAALDQQETSAFDAELVARGLLTADWSNLSAGALDAFPDDLPLSGPRGGEVALAALAVAVSGWDEASSRDLTMMLPALVRLADPDRREQADFWASAAPQLIEVYALALIREASDQLGSNELGSIRILLEKADRHVLAWDIGKLNKLHRAPPAADRTWRVPASTLTSSPVRQACVLGTGQMLAWRESRLMQLFDRNGGIVWQQNLSDVSGIVPLGSGPNAIIIQHQPDGTQLLTRFASHRRSFHPIGKVRLAAHHDLTTEGQWLVQIGGEIGALDLVKLCAPSPELEFLWSSQLTERLRAIAFGHRPGMPQWLTCDVSEGRAGVLELWTMERARDLTTQICIPLPADKGDDLRPPTEWIWEPSDSAHPLTAIASNRDPIWTTRWTIEAEQRAVAYARRRLAQDLKGQDSFVSCDFGRPYVRYQETTSSIQAAVHLARGHNPVFTFDFAPEIGLRCLARGAAMNGTRLVVFADETGRLFILDANTLNVVAV